MISTDHMKKRLFESIENHNTECEAAIERCNIEELVSSAFYFGQNLIKLRDMKYSGELSDAEVTELDKYSANMREIAGDAATKCICTQYP